MKNTKFMIFAATAVAVLLALRLGVDRLAEDDAVAEPNVGVNETRHSSVDKDNSLPSGEWAEGSAEPASEVVSSPEWEAQVEAFGFDPKAVAQQEQSNRQAKPAEEIEPQSPEQLFPGVADLLNDKLPDDYDQAQRQQDLARFVQSVAPSVQQIKASLSAMESYGMPEAQKKAYQKQGQEKIAALQQLKERALTLDSSLLDMMLSPAQ